MSDIEQAYDSRDENLEKELLSDNQNGKNQIMKKRTQLGFQQNQI